MFRFWRALLAALLLPGSALTAPLAYRSPQLSAQVFPLAVPGGEKALVVVDVPQGMQVLPGEPLPAAPVRTAVRLVFGSVTLRPEGETWPFLSGLQVAVMARPPAVQAEPLALQRYGQGQVRGTIVRQQGYVEVRTVRPLGKAYLTCVAQVDRQRTRDADLERVIEAAMTLCGAVRS